MLILKNGRILSMEAPEQTGDIAVKNGIIQHVGGVKANANDEVIDLGGRYVTPGLIDPHCHIGMWEDGIGFEGADGNESTDPITPQLRAIDAINPMDRAFSEAVAAGVTCAVTGPGSANVVGGQFAAVKTHGRYIDEMVLKAPSALKIALGENPKRVYKDQDKAPITRMATASLLRGALVQAQEYGRKLELAKTDEEKCPERDLAMETLLLALKGELIVKAHVHRADDIFTALRIAKEFSLNMTLDHCTEGYMFADVLKQNDVKPIIGPLITERAKVEMKNLSLKAPKTLHDAGIKFAIMTDHPVLPIQYLSVCAALAAREGLDEDTALRSITIHAAQLTGLDQWVGSIKEGKHADIAVFSGHPLDFRSRCELTLVNGRAAHNLL